MRGIPLLVFSSIHSDIFPFVTLTCYDDDYILSTKNDAARRTILHLRFKESINRESGSRGFLAGIAVTYIDVVWLSSDLISDFATKTRTTSDCHRRGQWGNNFNKFLAH
jgi:hypothetical protein